MTKALTLVLRLSSIVILHFQSLSTSASRRAATPSRSSTVCRGREWRSTWSGSFPSIERQCGSSKATSGTVPKCARRVAGCDVVFHLAPGGSDHIRRKPSARPRGQHPGDVQRPGGSPGQLFHACGVFTSTNKVYGAVEDVLVTPDGRRYVYWDSRVGIDERRPLDFHSPYGCSNGAADQYTRIYHRSRPADGCLSSFLHLWPPSGQGIALRQGGAAARCAWGGRGQVLRNHTARITSNPRCPQRPTTTRTGCSTDGGSSVATTLAWSMRGRTSRPQWPWRSTQSIDALGLSRVSFAKRSKRNVSVVL